MASFWPSKPTVWFKFDVKLGPNMNCNYSRESLKGAKQTFGGYHTFSTPCSNKVLRVHCAFGELQLIAKLNYVLANSFFLTLINKSVLMNNVEYFTQCALPSLQFPDKIARNSPMCGQRSTTTTFLDDF